MAISATPWVERYRPKDLTDVSHQTEVISTLKNAVETNRLPHLLFYVRYRQFDSEPINWYICIWLCSIH